MNRLAAVFLIGLMAPEWATGESVQSAIGPPRVTRMRYYPVALERCQLARRVIHLAFSTPMAADAVAATRAPKAEQISFEPAGDQALAGPDLLFLLMSLQL